MSYLRVKGLSGIIAVVSCRTDQCVDSSKDKLCAKSNDMNKKHFTLYKHVHCYLLVEFEFTTVKEI